MRLPHELHLVDFWFMLFDQHLLESKTLGGAPPPSLRDACYARARGMRSGPDADPEIIENFVNGLEMGAMSALRDAWNKR